MNEILAKEIVYSIKNSDQVETAKDIVYSSTSSENLLMDIYTQKGMLKEEKRPAVIFIHGESSSCNELKNIGQYVSLGKLAAASGFTAVTFNHRMLLQGYNAKEVYEDIEKLLSYVIKNADSLNVDKQKIAVWSISAGVPFGLYAAMQNKLASIKCAVGYYGFADFDSLVKFFNLPISEGNKELLSPIKLLSLVNSSNIAPLFIARAGLDNPTINESLDRFIAKALQNNLLIDIYNHPTGQHAFDLLNDNNRTHEIIHKTMEFLKLHLLK